MAIVRLVVLGASQSGKSSIVDNIIKNNFLDKQSTTRKRTCYHLARYRKKIVSVLLTEQNFYLTSQRNASLSSCNGIVYVFDLCSLDSLEETLTMIKEVNTSKEFAKIPFIIVGNKSDMESKLDGAAVSSLLSRLFKNVCYKEISAKADTALNELVVEFIR